MASPPSGLFARLYGEFFQDLYNDLRDGSCHFQLPVDERTTHWNLCRHEAYVSDN